MLLLQVGLGGRTGDRRHHCAGQLRLVWIWHREDFFLEASLIGDQAGVWSAASAIFLQLEPQHQPRAYSVGLLQEPCDGGRDADAGRPGNVLHGEA